MSRLFGVVLLAFAGGASAIGLGDLRGQPALGETLNVEIPLLGAEKQALSNLCVKLIQPQESGDLPWLKKATLSVRRSPIPLIEIRTDAPMREPVLQLAVYLGCGVEVSKEYTLILSPARNTVPVVALPTAEAVAERPAVKTRVSRGEAASDDGTIREVRRRVAGKSNAKGIPDRPASPLVIEPVVRWGDLEVGEPALRLATSLAFADVEGRTGEAQRDMLRLEYRMLMAMQEQAVTQLEAAEKLRKMEGALGELKQRAAEFAQRVEEGKPLAPVTTENQGAAQVSAAPAPEAKPVPETIANASGKGLWSIAAALLGALVGVGGWLAWRRRQNVTSHFGQGPHSIIPDVRVDPQRVDEHEERGGVDLHVEPAAMGMPMHVDLELEEQAAKTPEHQPEPVKKPVHDSMMSIAATSVDEHFEANPVMELADIMLSFGRVKGAAQALQEYIDNNPQEALKPWIRLMEVYRMAGMRQEFEDVARNLNRNFNVEVQKWEDRDALPVSEEEFPLLTQALPPRPVSIEDMPRIMSNVVEMWNAADVVGYLFELLRDNRGGQRVGFSLPVVEDILFLIELKETANRME